jgi:FAD/FMN-containing dehydrogenase/Fe-S oxidoreductase
VDELRARIHEDLRGVLEGDLLFEPVQRAPYAQDGSLFEVDPLGVIVPRSRDDVVAAVRYAADQGIPLHARGAGTGVAGESLGPGLVLDFSRHFRRIGAVGPDSVVAQAGVVLDVLNARLAPSGRRLGPDPIGAPVVTVGGMIGSNAAGPRSLRLGPMADHIERLEVVLADGEVVTLGREPRPSSEAEPADSRARLAHKIAILLDRHAELIARRAEAAPEGRSGYVLHGVATAGVIDLARLLAGSQGTLALVTEATLRIVPLPGARGAVLLPFGRLGDAAGAVALCLGAGPSACELLDRRSLHLVRDAAPSYRDWIAEAAEAALVVEFEGDDPAEVAGRVRRLTRRFFHGRALVGPAIEALEPADCDRLLGLRRVVQPLLMRMKGPTHPVPLIEELAVPPAVLPEFLRRLQNILKGHEVNGTLHGYVGHGQLHVRPFLDLSDPRDVAKLEPLGVAILEAALEVGGTATGEHGRGLVGPQLFRRQQGELAPVFREIKNAFDPQGLLNPGKVVGDDGPSVPRDLRALPPPVADLPVAAPAPALEEPAPAPVAAEADAGLGPALPVLEPALRWPERGFVETAAACNGCGACRTQEPTLRMCPTFRALHAEAAAPRAKAGIVRQLAAGVVDPKLWGTDELKQVADLCVHCHLCQSECPAGVDVSSLMLEAKAAYVENHGLAPIDWALSRIETWSKLASRVPITFNALMASRAARWVIERLCGLSRLRRLPRAHRMPFVRRAEWRGLTRPRPREPGPRVAYFVDIVANYFDQALAETVVAVLQQAGVNVYVPKGQRGCGMPALAVGDLDTARSQAQANLRVLGDAVRDGYTIVCSEPTAALMLRREYQKLTDDMDAALVAEHTMDVGQYLTGLAGRGQLPLPEVPLEARVGYHQPCHLRALDIGTPGIDLMRMVPGLEVEFIDRGCSGIAGIYGLSRQNFLTSLRAGRGLIGRFREPDIDIGASECGACRMQMEQGSPKRTYHPVKLLGLGYGMLPALRRRFKDPKPEHVVS